MYPWNLEDLGPIVVGRPVLPALQGIIAAQLGVKIGRSVLEKLCAAETNFYPKTIEQYNLAFPLEIIRSEPFQGIAPTNRPYRELFNATTKLREHFAQHPSATPMNLFHQGLRELFTNTIASVLWVEDYWTSFCERGGSMKVNEPSGPLASFPLEILERLPQIYGEEETRFRVGLLLEHHFFMLYMAAFEMDLAQQEMAYAVPKPSEFVPTENNGTTHYPMWSFWRWLRHKAQCVTWADLAKKADFNKSDSSEGAEGEQLVRNWANAKPSKGQLSAAKCKMISWKRLRQALAKLEGPNSDPWSDFQLEVQWGYGIARILQEHAARCLPTILSCGTGAISLSACYQDRIEACKENECRRIPPAPIAQS